MEENHQEHFSFLAIKLNDVERKIDLPDAAKANQQNDIQVEIIETNHGILNLLYINLTKLFPTQGFLTFAKVHRLNGFSRKNLEL